jgi:hypothetical protein
MKNFSYLLSFILLIGNTVFAQPVIDWSANYGGSLADRSNTGIITTDGGYIIGGYSFSSDSNVSTNYGYHDCWLLKISESGDLEWENSFGGDGPEWVHGIRQTPDGGYAFVGVNGSDDNYMVSDNHGSYDGWLVKLDSDGNYEWHKSYGGPLNETFYDFIQLEDESFVMTGACWSNTVNGIPVSNHGSCDLWIVKTDSQGNIIWQHLYGGYHQDDGQSIEQTPDGGFIICGTTLSDDGNVSGFHGFWDRWIVKLDSLGNIEWTKCYGGSEADAGRDIALTNDGGYIAIGESRSIDGDVIGNHGGYDAWVTKIDSVGNLIWQRSLGGSDADNSCSIIQTQDEEYFIPAYTRSNDGDVIANHGLLDIWTVKLDPNGNIKWQRCFGGSNDDNSLCSLEIACDEYFIIGSSSSDDGDILSNFGSSDYWVLYIACESGPLSIEIKDSSYCNETELSAIGDFVEYYWNTGDTTQNIIVNSGGLYYVDAYTSDGCYNHAELMVPDPVQPFNGMEICMVSHDDSSGSNVIIYEPVLNVGIDSVIFYIFDTLTSNYERIGANPLSNHGIFIDDSADPDTVSYQYRLAIKDTCSNISSYSPYHKTVLLSRMEDQNNNIILNWNPYVGFEYNEFNIYRNFDNNGYELIGATTDTFYMDANALTGQNTYQIRIEKDTSCNPGNNIVFTHTASNPVTIDYIGLQENDFHNIKIFPNPVKDNLTISRSRMNEIIVFDVFDIYNRFIGHYEMPRGVNKMIIPTDGLPSGIYFININQTGIKRFIKH